MAAVPDASGGLYLMGSTEGSLGGTSAGHQDAWLARFDAAGNQLWIRQFGSSSGDAACGGAPDGAGGVLVTGPTGGDLADAMRARPIFGSRATTALAISFGSTRTAHPSSKVALESPRICPEGRTWWA